MTITPLDPQEKSGEKLNTAIREIQDLLMHDDINYQVAKLQKSPGRSVVIATSTQKPSISLNPPGWSESHKEEEIPVGTVKPYPNSDKLELVKQKRGWETRVKDTSGIPTTPQTDPWDDHSGADAPVTGPRSLHREEGSGLGDSEEVI